MKKEILETIEKIKSYFNDDVVAETEELESEEQEESAEVFGEGVLSDGTAISYEGELTEGTIVYIVGEDGEQVIAPEGQHTLGGDMEGTVITLDANGAVTEIVTAEVEEEAGEDFQKILDERMSEIAEPITKMLELFETMAKENQELTAKLSELEQSFNEFKDTPTQKEEKKRFAREEDGLTPRQRKLLEFKNNNK